MLDEAYYYGITPREADDLTLAEMASFIKAKRRQEMDLYKVLANVGYTTGMLASMSLSKRRPRFSECFRFPDEEKKPIDLDRAKAQMLVWAERVNRESRNTVKENRRGRRQN